MTTLRTAAQQALEALEGGADSWQLVGPAIDALKAALAEPVQEPVAWLWQHRETGRSRLLMPNERTATDVAAAFDVVGPLYLAPPQRKPLTVEEIAAINTSIPGHTPLGDAKVMFARAIERAHGIGGQP